MTQGSAARIRTQIERMRTLVRSAELSARKERLSAWSLAEHLDHMAKVSLWAMRAMMKPVVQPPPKGINLIGRLVLLFGWLPRGLGKAPERVRGVPATAAELDAAIANLERTFDALPLDSLRASRTPLVVHPFFGGLTPPQALRLIVVHTNHHLRIIDDILKA